ncbi:hypothetical protein PROFUN_07624 [Planoprotostelium fungivorum]|uniref:Uncharacterized protein n=1 Tax=Planoprotostelium fungivorum TaxID=1890364 RepID=A0A2P6NK42_9EUKA|nr:hypothetical protein PROFUN_07624 [Planoprotostelium fungivorum]
MGSGDLRSRLLYTVSSCFGTPSHGGFTQLEALAIHFLLNTQSSKPTTASKPQQRWEYLTWISIEIQVAPANITPQDLLIKSMRAYRICFISLPSW